MCPFFGKIRLLISASKRRQTNNERRKRSRGRPALTALFCLLMIANNLIQAAIISHLKANANLTAYLTAQAATNEIRELEWQAAQFVYPSVRVGIGTQTPDTITSVCYTTNGEVTFTVVCFGEGDSSLQADELAGLVNDALVGTRLSGAGFRSNVIQSDGLTHAARTGERVWRAVGLYRAYIYET